MKIEDVKNEIKNLEEMIELEKSFNKNSGNLSFLYYQLHCEKEKLKKLEENKNGNN